MSDVDCLPGWLLPILGRIIGMITRDGAMEHFRKQVLEGMERRSSKQDEIWNWRDDHRQTLAKWCLKPLRGRVMTAPGMTGRHLWMPPYLSWSNLPEYDEPLPLRRGAMTIAEKYLVVAVIHDAYRKAGALINPWHADEATEDTELTKEVMRFHTLASVYQDWMKLAKRMEAADVASLNALVAEVEKDLAAAIGGADTPQSAPVVEDSDEQQGQAPALTKNDQRVLLAMGRMDRSILASAVDVADEIDEDERPSVRTIYPAIVRLVELGLAERSEGERQGARLTNKGRALTEKIAD